MNSNTSIETIYNIHCYLSTIQFFFHQFLKSCDEFYFILFFILFFLSHGLIFLAEAIIDLLYVLLALLFFLLLFFLARMIFESKNVLLDKLFGGEEFVNNLYLFLISMLLCIF